MSRGAAGQPQAHGTEAVTLTSEALGTAPPPPMPSTAQELGQRGGAWSLQPPSPGPAAPPAPTWVPCVSSGSGLSILSMRSLEFHLVMSLGNISSESDRSSGEEGAGLQHPLERRDWGARGGPAGGSRASLAYIRPVLASTPLFCSRMNT